MDCIENTADILVYAIPKVGTKTITASLSRIGILIAKEHSLSGRHPIDSQIEDNASINLRSEILKNHAPIKIITAAREPVSRKLSSFFQDLGSYGISSVMQPSTMFLSQISEFVQQKENAANNITRKDLFDWFDQELKAVFGIDVYAHPFDKEKEYSIIRQNNIEVLVLKLEKLNDLEQVIGDFVGAPHVKLVNANEAIDKPYKYLYNNMRAYKIGRAHV